MKLVQVPPLAVPSQDEPSPGGGRTIVREARGAAEQAVEESVVPSRYHAFIQRYFGRLAETVDRAEAGTSSNEPAQSDGGSS